MRVDPPGPTRPVLHVLMPTSFGPVGVVWRRAETTVRVWRVFLSSGRASAQTLLRRGYATSRQSTCEAIERLIDGMRRFLMGEAVSFSGVPLALEQCSDFQRRVLMAEREIPRGRVSTYGAIATRIGVERGARAVGQALSHNPFPILIPCHRAIRSDGRLGGFQGGAEMKRRLLELEGVTFGRDEAVVSPGLYY